MLAAMDLADDFVVAARPFWHPVARAADLAPGDVVPVTLLGEQLVLWRLPDGTLSLLDDLCSHRGVRLSQGSVTEAGCLRCPYHAWEYDGDGHCTRIPQLPHGRVPSRANVPGYRTGEHAGLVWACLVPEGEERRPAPRFAEVDDLATHWLHVGEPMDWDCQAPRQIENFCDVAHFSVLHLDTFGNPDEVVVAPYEVDASPDGERLAFDFPYVSGYSEGSAAGDAQDDGDDRYGMVFRYRVELPFAVRLGNAAGPGSVMFVATAPTTATTCRVFWCTGFALGTEVDIPAFEAIEDAVWAPDRRVVEGQRPERLPVDLTEELHLPFDRFAVAYRRALTDLGFPSPTRRPAPL
jgi:phenylpropionate dioxygenase-like ring-hydroxylating dioxygenase large terminal subunit